MKNKNTDIANVDNQGNVISESFPVSKRTVKDQSKTSVFYTVLAVILHILAFVPLIAVSAVLASKCSKLLPYYGLWPYIGVIIILVFGLIFLAVTLIVTRRRSKSSISGQTAKVAFTFICLTSVFALLITYLLPDVIANATQNTLYAEDVMYNGEAQAEKNAKLERDFIMYNVLNGNFNEDKPDGDFSYATLSKCVKTENNIIKSYENAEINRIVSEYNNLKDDATRKKQFEAALATMKENQPMKYEMYEFIYNSYVLTDYDYAFYNRIGRKVFTLALTDYVYSHSSYSKLIKEGFKNKKLKQIFDNNFDNFNHDGYQPFDDPMLLYAQMDGRMTVPVVLRLILNEGWKYSQPAYDAEGKMYYTEDGNCLYEVYDPGVLQKFKDDGGEFKYNGKLMDINGVMKDVKYGINSDGWLVYQNGVVKRTVDWLVLDMLGDPMSVKSLDIYGLSIGGVNLNSFKFIIDNIINGGLLKPLFDSVGEVLTDDLANLIREATNGADLSISIYFDDNDKLAINILPMNAKYGMLGYMQASWVQSDNLLMAVINVLGIRNWLCLFGAIGIILVIAAGICRDCGRKTRLRTEVSRDRIMRAMTAERIENGEVDPSELELPNDGSGEITAQNITAADVVAIENAQNPKKREKSAAGAMKEAPQSDEDDTPDEDETEEEKPAREKRFGKRNKRKDEVEESEDETDDLDVEDESEEEKPAKNKRKREKKKKVAEESIEDTEEEVADEADDSEDYEEPVKEKKGRSGKRNKRKDKAKEAEHNAQDDEFDDQFYEDLVDDLDDDDFDDFE